MVSVLHLQVQVTFRGIRSSGQADSSSFSSLSLQQGCFSFFVQFPEGCALATSKCEVNVSERNVVLVMEKGEECRNQWKKFDVGLNPQQTQVYARSPCLPSSLLLLPFTPSLLLPPRFTPSLLLLLASLPLSSSSSSSLLLPSLPPSPSPSPSPTAYLSSQEKFFLTEDYVMQLVETLDSLPSPWVSTAKQFDDVQSWSQIVFALAKFWAV